MVSRATCRTISQACSRITTGLRMRNRTMSGQTIMSGRIMCSRTIGRRMQHRATVRLMLNRITSGQTTHNQTTIDRRIRSPITIDRLSRIMSVQITCSRTIGRRMQHRATVRPALNRTTTGPITPSRTITARLAMIVRRQPVQRTHHQTATRNWSRGTSKNSRTCGDKRIKSANA